MILMLIVVRVKFLLVSKLRRNVVRHFVKKKLRMLLKIHGALAISNILPV
jgi:hypothetical protein